MAKDRSVTKTSGNGNEDVARDFSHVQVIGRAALILRTLRDTGGCNLSDLARAVGLPRSTAFRIVKSLEEERLVNSKGDNGNIQLGMGLVSLGAAVNRNVREELRPYLESLSQEVGGETIDLAILDEDHLLFIDQVTPPNRLRAVSGVGYNFPLHCTANGKAILSTLPVDEVKRMLPEELQIYTSNTIPTRSQLLTELQEIRLLGIAMDREEHTMGICAVGAVVTLPNRKTAVISIPIPTIRFEGKEEKFVHALLLTRNMINARFQSF
jgi:DNA-binding IclR family transcriptional regulator